MRFSLGRVEFGLFQINCCGQVLSFWVLRMAVLKSRIGTYMIFEAGSGPGHFQHFVPRQFLSATANPQVTLRSLAISPQWPSSLSQNMIV